MLSLQDVDHQHRRFTGQDAAFSACKPGWERRKLSLHPQPKGSVGGSHGSMHAWHPNWVFSYLDNR